MKLNKVAFAVASVLAIASGYSHAGNIDSSNATLAIEVIKNDTQVVRAPSKGYAFVGSLDSRDNEKTLQLQYTLSQGTWAVSSTNIIKNIDELTDITMALPSPVSANNATGVTSGILNVTYIDAAGKAQTTFPAGTTVKAFVTNSKKTLVFNVTIPAPAVGSTEAVRAPYAMTTPNFSINSTDFGTSYSDQSGGKGNIGVNGLYTVTGATACPAPDSTIKVTFAHATSHAGSATLQPTTAADSENNRPSATNESTLFNFTQNLIFNFAAASNTSRTDAAYTNFRITGTNWETTVGNTGYVAQPTVATTTGKRHYIGKVSASLRKSGLDLDYTKIYGNPDSTTGFLAAEFDATDDIGNLNAGQIEAKDLTIKLTLPAAWPTGTIVRLVDVAGASTGVADVTTTAGQTELNFVATTAADLVKLFTGAYLFADFPGDALIPQTTSVAATATLSKDATAGTPDYREQDNICKGTLAGIGGGIKIDVRNYASYATFGATGPASIVRLINNSESGTADVYGQMIYADGTYGPWGKLADLKPREVINMSNKSIEALLTNAANQTASGGFGGSTVYTKVAGASVVASPKAGSGDRLRIVSNTGSTLRVQSYLTLGSTVLDTSNAQGVDFENSGDRVPTNGVDAQPISQDAINGLAK